MHSGVIDLKMYDMLLRAGLVIADISTGNANAIYELGVRHALRPSSTIIMKESEGRLHFDLNHINTFTYQHMGEDIGQREAKRATAALKAIIARSTADKRPDSPVYTFLPKLRHPTLTNQEFEELIYEVEEVQDRFAEVLDAAEKAAEASDHQTASKCFSEALTKSPTNAYLRQQAALHTYKSKIPSEWLALDQAEDILAPLNPERSNDPETLGIAGAIYKRMWDLSQDKATLDKAIELYRRGFEVRGDYYTGENAATCLDMRANIQTDADEAKFDRMLSIKIRSAIIASLKVMVNSEEFDERSDKLWVYATLANCLFAADDEDGALVFERLFEGLEPQEWQRKTYLAGKKRALEAGRSI